METKIVKNKILKESEKLLKNINKINDALEPRDYFDDEDEIMGDESFIALTYHSFYDEAVKAKEGFKKFHEELTKRVNGNDTARTWFLRVENAVCWMKYGSDDMGLYSSECEEMYNSYWSIVDLCKSIEDELF